MKTQENYLGLARRYFRGKSWEVSEKKADHRITECSYLQLVDTEYSDDGDGGGVTCLHLPPDVWLGILDQLQVMDIVRYPGYYNITKVCNQRDCLRKSKYRY